MTNERMTSFSYCKAPKASYSTTHQKDQQNFELLNCFLLQTDIFRFVSFEAETPLSPGCTLMSPRVGTQLTPQWSPGWTPLSPPCTQHKEQIINLTNLEYERQKVMQKREEKVGESNNTHIY